jgi:actin-related protein 3
MKRGTEDLDFFIGDEALAAANGPGTWADILMVDQVANKT